MKHVHLVSAFAVSITLLTMSVASSKTPEAGYTGASCCPMHAALEKSPAPKGEMLANSRVQVVLASEVDWQQLNPARGNQSPQAGTLWGDRKGEVPTGFLAKFVDGFSSPPHIHNATYRAVVISGEIHNDDPAAEKMWMPAGSFWTQPKGETHITAAKGAVNIALVEIDEGPYLVMPPSESFDSGERPIHIDPSNLMWLDASESERVSVDGAEVAFLWGSLDDGRSNGTFIKLAPGFKGTIKSQGSTFRAVVIQGIPQYHLLNESKALEPGSYFSSTGDNEHQIASDTKEESLIYVRTDGAYELLPAN